MIKAIFYSKFDTIEGKDLQDADKPSIAYILTMHYYTGPKVVHQVPDGAIVPSPTAPSQPPFLTFSDVSFFVIPANELCGTFCKSAQTDIVSWATQSA
jgi:hypothetical protein